MEHDAMKMDNAQKTCSVYEYITFVTGKLKLMILFQMGYEVRISHWSDDNNLL